MFYKWQVFIVVANGFEHSWVLRNMESISRKLRNTWQQEISPQGQNPQSVHTE